MDRKVCFERQPINCGVIKRKEATLIVAEQTKKGLNYAFHCQQKVKVNRLLLSMPGEG